MEQVVTACSDHPHQDGKIENHHEHITGRDKGDAASTGLEVFYQLVFAGKEIDDFEFIVAMMVGYGRDQQPFGPTTA
jgi:hypothetical protein